MGSAVLAAIENAIDTKSGINDGINWFPHPSGGNPDCRLDEEKTKGIDQGDIR